MHLDLWLPERIALGAELEEESGEEELELDSGIVDTNQRWAAVRQTYSIGMPPMRGTDPDLAALRALWRAARRSHSFNMLDFTDESDGTAVKVRFRSDLKIVALGAGLYQIDGLTLMEDKSA